MDKRPNNCSAEQWKIFERKLCRKDISLKGCCEANGVKVSRIRFISCQREIWQGNSHHFKREVQDFSTQQQITCYPLLDEQVRIWSGRKRFLRFCITYIYRMLQVVAARLRKDYVLIYWSHIRASPFALADISLVE